jgi:predicted nucleic acid-binding Zn ribbon protein
MRQNLADLESAFVDSIHQEREEAARQRKQAVARCRRRESERRHKRGTMRFWLLVLTLIGTAVLVTVVMFQALYYVMG